jgi:outer membrane lipoprotein SlyB
MDDGSTRVITQEWAPSFRSGDRVRVEKGMIQR